MSETAVGLFLSDMANYLRLICICHVTTFRLPPKATVCRCRLANLAALRVVKAGLCAKCEGSVKATSYSVVTHFRKGPRSEKSRRAAKEREENT